MKRRRISRVTDSNLKTGEGSSFSDLPMDILLNILLRLSIKSILVFKYVCKTWYDLVSDPQFAKLHFDQAQVYPLIRTRYSRYGSKFVHLMDPNKDDFELKLGMCDHLFTKPGCACNVQVKIDTKFEMPERYGLMTHNYSYGIVTCNGLLCLYNPSREGLGCAIVCNPITGEFINLPEPELVHSNGYNTCYGFGFSPATNQYKVLRMSPNKTRAHVHILGTKTWKEIGFFKESMPKLSPAYLNGFLYWSSDSQGTYICTFDIENECFGSIVAPTLNRYYQDVNMGVLGGQLCICGVLKPGHICVWILKDKGTKRVWSIDFSYDGYIGVFQPIKYMNDGALLMFSRLENALVYMDPKKGRLRYLKVSRFKDGSRVEAMSYTPSFVSLKHVLSGQDVKVHNVRSRCVKLKPSKEDDIDIVEKLRVADGCF